MSVELNPVELGFRRPFTQEVSQTLSLRNPNSDPIAFKVKTTAPKQYCVRPNSGRIEPGEVVDVLVLLQAMKEDPPLDAKCRDKFLVQSVAVRADQEFTNVAQVWANIEQTAKSSILEKKIRVSFLPADGSAATPAKSTANHHDEEPPAYGSPYSNAATPAQAAAGEYSKSSDRPAEAKDLGTIKSESANPAAQSYLGAAAGGVAAAASGAAAAIPKSSEDVNQQLKAAQAQIATLKEQLAAGLRQRKTAGDTATATKTSSATSVQPSVAGGVAVPMVAALCLLSFLLAYLFF